MTAQRLFIIIGLCAAVLFTFITPPFQVPDEVGHFWRAVSIAQGTIFPRIEAGSGVDEVPQGLSTIVFCFWKPTAGAQNVKITWAQFETSKYVRIESEKRARIVFPAGYTPAPYLPQIAAALVSRLLSTRPVITFYLGRLFNAIAYAAIIALAIRIAPTLRWFIAAAALLPMGLYLAASWSPDAMTIAASFLFTAGLLRGARNPREVGLLALIGAFVGLCKPAYFLIALLALAIPVTRGAARALIIGATSIGVALAIWSAAQTAPVRRDVRVDPAAQIDCIRHDPARALDTFAGEARVRGFDYVRQAIGRLGLLDVWLPEPVVWVELALLLLCTWTAGAVAPRIRMTAAIISLLTLAGIALSAYLGWTPPCAQRIDGLQGRYLLPIAPVMAGVIGSAIIRREEIARFALPAVAVVANAFALFAVASRYYW
jgi:uncharacterized membrane protein